MFFKAGWIEKTSSYNRTFVELKLQNEINVRPTGY